MCETREISKELKKGMSDFSEAPYDSWFNLGVKGKKVLLHFHTPDISGTTVKEEGKAGRIKSCDYVSVGVFIFCVRAKASLLEPVEQVKKRSRIPRPVAVVKRPRWFL